MSDVKQIGDAGLGPRGVLDTLPKLLRENYRRHPQEIALQEKHLGIWRTHTWKDYYERVKYLCLGLRALGLGRQDRVAILGENKPEWYIAEIAVQALGAIAVGIFPDCVPGELKFYLDHSGCAVVVAHDQEQVDKVLRIKHELPQLRRLIYWDPKGLWNYSDDILLSLDRVIETGKKYEESHPSLFDESVDLGSPDDVAVICYTSGTTGTPKGAMMNQHWLVEGAKAWGSSDQWAGKGYQYVSFIPPAWGTEQLIGIAGSLLGGITVSFPEDAETVQEDLREIGPDILFYGARMWELVSRSIQARIMDSTLVRRTIYRIALSIGMDVARRRSEMKEISPSRRLLYFAARHTLFRQLLDRIGLSRVKLAYSGGAALSPDIILYFLALGVSIKMVYGSTELGLVSIPRPGDVSPEASGSVVPWAEVKISDEGEILVRSELAFCGYYKDPVATANKFMDGWYRTGDFGHMDEEGHLIVIDRMEDLKPLAGGKRFSPQYIETRLRFSPFIKDALVVGGEDKEYVISIINIDIDNVGRFAEKRGVPYTTFSDLSQKPEVIELIRGEVLKVNRTLPDYSRVRRFANLHKEFDPDEAELTRTRKLRRGFVEDRYREIIEAIYGGREMHEAEATVRYRDGRTAVAKTAIRFNSIEA
jgi:long-chain acyl-CoA synthetase